MQKTIRLLVLAFLLISANLSVAQNNTNNELALPLFSADSGFYHNEFELILSHSDPSITIYYTLDGSIPDPDNISGDTFKYKNSYQQPSSSNKAINIKNNFLYKEYKTNKYDQAITIKNRISEPDSVTQVSTTNEITPYYLPTAKKDEQHWLNKFINKTNRIIISANHKIDKFNRAINSGYRKAYTFFTKEKISLGKHEFIGQIPQITYAIYTKPIEYSFKGTPVRAIAVDSQGKQSQVETKTYFVGDRNQFQLPLLTITIPEKDLFSYKKGIFVAGKTYDDWIATGAEIPKNDKPPFNWVEKGKKKANIVFDFADKNYSADVDIKAAGLGTRFLSNKSIKVYPSKKYTENGLDFPVFDSNHNIGFTRLTLRNNAYDGGSNIKDNIFQRVANGLNFATQNDKTYFTFINGEPNGILTAKYRYDKRYLQDIYNLPNDKIDLIKMLWPVSTVSVLEGDKQAWDKLIESLRNKSDLETIKNQMDISSFIDYFAVEIFLDNDDWPHNNLRAWRYKGNDKIIDKVNNKTNDQTNDETNNETNYEIDDKANDIANSKANVIDDNNNTLLDGRWRWMMFDMDAIGARKTDIYLHRNRLRILLNGDKDVDPVFIFQSLMAYDEIQQEFITRINDLMNSTFKPQRVIDFINQASNNVKHDMPKQIQRWQTHADMDSWEYSVQQMIDFANKRPNIQRQQLKEQFKLNDLYDLVVDVNNLAYGSVKLNTIHLGLNDQQLSQPIAASIPASSMTDVLSFPWQGKYFKEMPLSIQAIAQPGYAFSHWDVTGLDVESKQLQNEKLIIHPSQDTRITAVFKPD